MKKIIFTKEEINNIIKLYIVDLLSSQLISLKYNVDNGVIRRLLKENGIKLRNSGRVNLGGKKVADKKYHEKNKEKVNSYYASWLNENKEHRKEYMKNYQKNNKEQIRKRKREYEKNRKSKDPIYKLIGNFRTAIYIVLKENNMSKFGHYFDVLGYSQNDLVKHLESQFKNGITWENYGKWHVDHILPIDSFTFNDMNDPEFIKCWSLDNLQPMWGGENISKSNHIL